MAELPWSKVILDILLLKILNNLTPSTMLTLQCSGLEIMLNWGERSFLKNNPQVGKELAHLNIWANRQKIQCR